MGPRTPELLALFGIVGVHLVPKLLQRARIPAPVTALVLGAVVAHFVPGLAHDPTLSLLSTIGISALFLFAGLEVDAEVLGERPALLIAGLVAHTLAIAAATVFGVFGLNLSIAPAMLLALGIATPSGGFILDGLSGLGATPVERHAIRDTALIAEILSLFMFFVVTQSTGVAQFAGGVIGLGALLVLVPFVLRLLVRYVVPHATNSEFPLLVLMAIVGAYTTRRLSLYYLIGAFVVGIVARRLRTEAPALASDKNLSAIELFAAFFAPFYFARAGMEFDPSRLGLRGIGLGAVLLVFATPARIALIGVARHLATGEPLRRSMRISSAIIPTFVFSLVMGQVLGDRFPEAAWVQGGLIVFAVGNAFVPGLLMRSIASKEHGTDAAESTGNHRESRTSTPSVVPEVVTKPLDTSPIARLMLSPPGTAQSRATPAPAPRSPDVSDVSDVPAPIEVPATADSSETPRDTDEDVVAQGRAEEPA